MDWIHENPPRWDADKSRILGGAPAGALPVVAHASGALLPGEWWRVEDAGRVVGYGWMDCTWGDAEMLLAVDAAHHGRGVGGFILDGLAREAASRGLNYLYNVVLETHPDRERVMRWLEARGFAKSHDGDRLKRRVGRSTG